CWSHCALQHREANVYSPPNVRPIRAGGAELGWLGALVAEGQCDADRGYTRLVKREHHVARCDLPHELIKRITVVVSVALRRPKVTATSLLLERLVLVNPPIPHQRPAQFREGEVSVEAASSATC